MHMAAALAGCRSALVGPFLTLFAQTGSRPPLVGAPFLDLLTAFSQVERGLVGEP